MKEFLCPSCGAVLKFSATDSVAKCEFCGTITDLERSSEEIIIKKAHTLAQQVRDYVDMKRKVSKATDFLNEKNKNYNDVLEKKKALVPNVWLKFIAIWIACIILFGFLMNRLLYSFDVLPIILDVVFAGASGYYLFPHIKREKEKGLIKLNEAEQNALAEKENAENNLSEVSAAFDEDFIPASIRDNDEAINFIIGALESERAYTLNQAIGLWNDREFYQKQIEQTVSKSIEEKGKSTDEKSKNGAEIAGAFTGAALGAIGGAVAKKAVKEFFNHL